MSTQRSTSFTERNNRSVGWLGGWLVCRWLVCWLIGWTVVEVFVLRAVSVVSGVHGRWVQGAEEHVQPPWRAT